jgi:hypothetical protein
MERSEKKCENCIYYAKVSDEFGECRDRSPVAFMDDEACIHGGFPLVEPFKYCGRGCWEKYSDITNDTESYTFDMTHATTYWEDRPLKDKKDDDMEE